MLTMTTCSVLNKLVSLSVIKLSIHGHRGNGQSGVMKPARIKKFRFCKGLGWSYEKTLN